MKVRMLTQVSGAHDGADWPAPGEVVDLPDVDAEAMVAGGVAEKVDEKADKAAAKAEAAEAKTEAVKTETVKTEKPYSTKDK